MIYQWSRKPRKFGITSLFIMFLTMPLTGIGHVVGNGMPWEGRLEHILSSLTGPWFKFGSVTVSITLGLMLAFGDPGGIMEQALQAGLALAILCTALGWGLSFFKFSGSFRF